MTAGVGVDGDGDGLGRCRVAAGDGLLGSGVDGVGETLLRGGLGEGWCVGRCDGAVVWLALLGELCWAFGAT